jgi:hypothetical protein
MRMRCFRAGGWVRGGAKYEVPASVYWVRGRIRRRGKTQNAPTRISYERSESLEPRAAQPAASSQPRQIRRDHQHEKRARFARSGSPVSSRIPIIPAHRSLFHFEWPAAGRSPLALAGKKQKGNTAAYDRGVCTSRTERATSTTNIQLIGEDLAPHELVDVFPS